MAGKVSAFTAGADDYVTKPFELEEIFAPLHALVRRANGWTSALLVCGPVMLDTHRRCVTVNGRPVALSNFELRILEHLMLCAGKVISKQELAERSMTKTWSRKVTSLKCTWLNCAGSSIRMTN